MRHVNKVRNSILFLVFGGLTSISFSSGDFPTGNYGPLDEPCHPLATTSCALPYPSDIYAHEDVTSATGVRLDFPVGMVREELLKDIPDSLTPQSVFNGSDGFSAATPVLFEMFEAPDLDTMPISGGESAIAYNLDTGKRANVRLQMNEYARSDSVTAPSQLLEVYPRSRWGFGDRYVVVLTNELKTDEGENHQPSEGFVKSSSNDGSRLANYYEPAFAFLESKGHARENLNAITFFTVRSENEVTEPMKKLASYVYEADHPIRNVNVSYPVVGSTKAKVQGEVYVHNFRNSDGGMDFDLAKVEGHWIEFNLYLPKAAKHKQVPVSIYSHGLGAEQKGVLTDIIVAENSKLGVATVTIDHPNHGAREEKDGGGATANLSPAYVPQKVGMMFQSSVDAMSLLKSIKTHMAKIDVLPKGYSGWFFSRPAGDGVPELDVSRVMYQGTSLGGVLGSTFVALAPELKGAFLHVTGVGITGILSNSMLWDGGFGTSFSKLVPADANGAEAAVLKGAIQHEMDYGDGINFVHYYRNPPAGVQAKPVAILAGVGDKVVPNPSTVAMAEIAQLPMVGTEWFEVPGVEKRRTFDEGYGVVQKLPLFYIVGLDPISGLLAHGSFLRIDAGVTMRAWIKKVMFNNEWYEL